MFWVVVMAIHYEKKAAEVAKRLQELLKLLPHVLMGPWAFLGMWDNDIDVGVVDVSDARPPRPRGDEDRWPK